MRFLLAIALFVSLLAAGTVSASAQSPNDDIWRAGPRINVVADGHRDVWAAGALVNVRGTIGHELHAVGAEVDVDTTTVGDAYVAGAVVGVSGQYQRDLYVAGAQVKIDAQIKGDMKAGGARVLIGRQTAVRGSMSLAGADIVYAGVSGGKVDIYGDTVHIDGRIAGDLLVHARNVSIGKDAVIGGNATFQTFNEPQIAAGATIHGRQTVTLPRPPQQGGSHAAQALFGLVFFSIAAGFVAGLVLLIVRRPFVERAMLLLRAQPGRTFGIGLLVLILIPLVAVSLTATIIGIPTALLFLLALPLLWLTASVIAAFTMGDFLANRERRRRSFVGELWLLIIGVVVLTVIGIIPYVGLLSWFLALIFGLGATWRALRGVSPPSAPALAETIGQ